MAYKNLKAGTKRLLQRSKQHKDPTAKRFIPKGNRVGTARLYKAWKRLNGRQYLRNIITS